MRRATKSSKANAIEIPLLMDMLENAPITYVVLRADGDGQLSSSR